MISRGVVAESIKKQDLKKKLLQLNWALKSVENTEFSCNRKAESRGNKPGKCSPQDAEK